MRRHARWLVVPALLLVAGLLFAAQRRTRPPPPRFCAQDLSGVWVNASDPTFAYRLRDRGEHVDGVFFRRGADGGLLPPQKDEEPLTIDLHRTDGGLAGAMRTFDRTEKGRRCPVEFGLSVSSCSPDALQLVTETSVPIREDCQRGREADGGEAAPALSEFVWERPGAGH